MNKEQQIAILGGGPVGSTLANGLRTKGYQVDIGNRKGTDVVGWDGRVGTYEDVSASADAFILVVNGRAAEEVVSSIKHNLGHKIVIDATNPINNAPPDDSVLDYFTTLHDSLMERLQLAAPEARFVKALNSVGYQHMIDPAFPDGPPSMFICGNDGTAKDEVSELLKELGWEPEDFGGVKSARAIEPLCMLWCIPAMARNQWNHAFKLLKA